MKINKAKASNYNDVTTNNIVDYIRAYQAANTILLNTNTNLSKCNKTQLKAVASELETVNKRLEFLVNNKY